MNKFDFNHPIIHSGALDEFCQPFFELSKIKTFGFIEIYESGKFIQLESNSKIYSDLLASTFLHDLPLAILNYSPRPGFYLNEYSNVQSEIITRLKKKYHLANGIGYIDLVEDKTANTYKICHYYFSSHEDNREIVGFYLNEQAKLLDFCNHFYQRFQPLIGSLKKFDIGSEFKELFNIKFHEFINKNLQQQNDCRVNSDDNSYVFDYDSIPFNIKNIPKLGTREKDVIYLWYNGFSVNKIAEILEVSSRTIQRTFHIIMNKLNCTSKIEIINKLWGPSKGHR
ncbi:LuxR C-terminal-related transcriptional regulator [Legionella tucsonensis]|uniref:LuxR family transcriptional regulator n=1 Tax=Legionella tucsonensis TaxID=40335 RepID=A0A0W0ZWC5_9GAMM|nr:LuxR C-terminal-related transcriptional regulator [Legionella tucsonensis]KTD73399.1 LuxR family transcriptional regulator [Legionella tucsonensis]